MKLTELLALTYDLHWSGAKAEDSSYANGQHVVTLLGSDLPVKRLGAPALQKLVKRLREHGNSPGTVNRKLAALSKMLTVAVEAGEIERKPVLPRLKEAEHRTRVLTVEEEQQMVALMGSIAGPDYSALVLFLVDTGMRVSEALHLRWEDIQRRPDSEEPWAVLKNTKARVVRSVPLTRRATACTRVEQRGKDDLPSRGPFARCKQSTFNHAWARCRDRMGLVGDEEFVPHALRHTCASRLVQRGTSVLVVQRWLGHKSVTTTQRYAHLRDDDLAKAVKVLESRAAS